MMRFILSCSLLHSFLVAGEGTPEEQPFIPEWTKEQSNTLNENLSREQDIRIRLHLEQRKNWDVIDTGSGLRVWVYEEHEGPTAQEDDQVDVKFEVRLLNDSWMYKSEEGELSICRVNKSDIETGGMEGRIEL